MASGATLVYSTETDDSPDPWHDDEVEYAMCGVCFYEKVRGEPCGLPCV